MRLAIVVPFLNEERVLPIFLQSVAEQTRRPDVLVLVDDGSSDTSSEQADAFARAHDFARVLHRVPRANERDRLATAAELRAFHAGVAELEAGFDVVAKMDADLRLSPRHVEAVLETLSRDPTVGVAGGFLSFLDDSGTCRREQHPVDHVRGPNKFYRRECLEQIGPLPEILGWDTIDDVRARMHGWRTTSVEIPGGDSVHLRPTGSHDGQVRAFRRWGRCAWGWGAHPVYVLAGAVFRLRQRPVVIGGLSYLWGYLWAAVRRPPRADPATRAAARREELRRLRGMVLPNQR